MRIATFVIASLVTLPLLLSACGDDKSQGEEEAFDTLADCYDDHHNGDEGLPVAEAIVVCCVEHPIGASREHPSCGADKAACVTHVRAELDASVTNTDIDTACADYVTQK